MTKPSHVIKVVTFVPGWRPGDAAPAMCECGWWGDQSEYPEHRKALGLPTASFYQWLTDGTKFMKSTAPSECPKGHVGRMRIHDGRWRCNECANEWARDARAKRREQVAA